MILRRVKKPALVAGFFVWASASVAQVTNVERVAEQAAVLLLFLLVQIGGRKKALESLRVIFRILNHSPESTGNRPQGIEDAGVTGQPE